MHDQYAAVGIKPNCEKSRKLKDARLVCGTLESERFEETPFRGVRIFGEQFLTVELELEFLASIFLQLS